MDFSQFQGMPPEDVMRMMKIMTKPMKEQVEDERNHFRTEYEPVFQMLNPRIEEFFKKQQQDGGSTTLPLGGSNSSTFPAVDIGSGSAIGTVTMALTLAPPILPENVELLWYPSDWAGKKGSSITGSPVECETRESLRYQIQESQECVPLFADKDGEPIFPDDKIELEGLKADHFNGRRGIIRGPDPKIAGRFKVQLSPDPSDCKSFKKENLSYMGETSLHSAKLRLLREEGKAEDFFIGLLERTREIDVLEPRTWSSVEELYGKCALVTCTSLLTCLGYRDPTAWKDTMQLASKLLCTDGYLLQYDAIGYADFGDTAVMQAFADDEVLGLKLETSTIPPDSWHNDRERKLMLWRKQ